MKHATQSRGLYLENNFALLLFCLIFSIQYTHANKRCIVQRRLKGFRMIKAIHTKYIKTSSGYEEKETLVEVFEIEDRYVRVAGHGRIETTSTSLGLMTVEEYESVCEDAYIGGGVNRRYTYR